MPHSDARAWECGSEPRGLSDDDARDVVQETVVAVAIERVKQKVGARRFQMFDLYVLKNWPVREVAKTLHTNVAQVYLVKHRVTALIREETTKLRKRMESEP